jgi:hypothetical protein
MTETLQRLRCARCGEYYWADQQHRCRSGRHLVLVRPRQEHTECDVGRVGIRHGALPRLPEPGGDGRSQPAVIEPGALQRRLRALEAEIDELKRASDRLRGNDSQYEAALELLVAEVVQLKDRLSQPDTAAESASVAEVDSAVDRRARRRARPPYPPRRRVAALMMWAFAVAVAAAGVAGLVLVRMLG